MFSSSPADSCPPTFSSSTKVSRSGRVIKPPLEYWKGGRVILDAHMNVTIHECYDTSICIPVSTWSWAYIGYIHIIYNICECQLSWLCRTNNWYSLVNVTIRNFYILQEVTTTVSARKSQKPARVFLPCSEGKDNRGGEVLMLWDKLWAACRQTVLCVSRPQTKWISQQWRGASTTEEG